MKLWVEPLASGQIGSILPLLEDYPFKPYQDHVSLAGGKDLSRYLGDQIAGAVAAGKSLWVCVGEGGDVLGLAFLSELVWDSQQLGFRTGRIEHLIAGGDYATQYEIKDALLQYALQECAALGIEYLVARVNASDLSSAYLLAQREFIALDGILTFALDLREAPLDQGDSNFEVRLSTEKDIERIKEIAFSSYIYDRFHSDPLIPQEAADKLHAMWLENSCLGKAADDVVVASKKGRVLGYVTCRINRQVERYLGLRVGTIVLVATAVEARRQGVARAASFGALRWFREQGVDIVEVGTQFRNIPASNLYQSCGFKLVAVSTTLRKWMGD